jgi:imidazolonepropionase-like amidohydrolase
VADGEAEIVKAVRIQVKYGADVIKTCATGGVLSEGDAVGVQQLDDEELAVLVREAHLTGRKVAAHAHGADGIKAALRAGVDSIEHGSMTDDAAIKLFKEKGAFLVPTLMAQESVERYAKEGVLKGQRAEKALHIAPLARQNLTKAFAAGVKVALGTDAGVFRHGTNGREFELMVALGMKPMDAILAGTKNAAELLGLEKEIGTVEPGKVADLVAVDGNPLDDIAAMTKVSFVMYRGTVFTEPVKPEKKGLARLLGK